ncbi:hypothetical protein N8J89_08050 [Crossiella sp. CA-258035]|uniref:hypothetical protein n=1 Tax=Crossiella sp. CA-258035 TaxID=2981138 RepID=UPI0024BC03B2|nr:hypothetical protein [Crossiella sp. CA-258035]WHT21007.1 hypothetical protein N8J89_08050 [Crossiella sp. CA-258035]
MPATALPVTNLGHKTGLNVTAADTGVAADNTNGNSVANGGRTFIIAQNTAGTSATVSVAVERNVDQQTVTPVTHTIPANKVHVIVLGPPAIYGQNTIVTASASTVKLAAYSMPS